MPDGEQQNIDKSNNSTHYFSFSLFMLCVIHGPRIIGLRLLIRRIRAESDPGGLDFLYKLPMPQAGGAPQQQDAPPTPRADPSIFHPKEDSLLQR